MMVAELKTAPSANNVARSVLADAPKNSECQWNISWEKMLITWPNCSLKLRCLQNDTKWWGITAEPTQITFNGPKANHGCPLQFWGCPKKLWMSLRCLTGQDFMDICCQVLLIVLCFFVISSEKHLHKYVNLCKCYIIFQCQGHWMLSKLVQHVFFKGEGGGYQKWSFEAIFRAKTGATGGGRGSWKPKLWEMSFMDPLLDFKP